MIELRQNFLNKFIYPSSSKPEYVFLFGHRKKDTMFCGNSPIISGVLQALSRFSILTICSIAVLISSGNVIAQTIPITTDSRIKTLVYNANEVYQLKFYYGYQSFIEFADDEETEMISIGESFSWRLTPAGKRLFIRPLEIGAHTNMTIITNKRTYQFDIASAEYDGRADEELVYTVRFYYPEIGVPLPLPPRFTQPNIPPNLPPNYQPAFQGNPAQPNLQTGKLMSVVKTPIPPQFVGTALTPEIHLNKGSGTLNFHYSIAGVSDNITPLKIYDDGKETFFQFKDKNLIVPTISIVDIFGNEQPVGYAVREGFVVAEATAPQFTLRLANSLICVFNEGMVNRPKNATANLYGKKIRN